MQASKDSSLEDSFYFKTVKGNYIDIENQWEKINHKTLTFVALPAVEN